jgi:hypothetical protein
MSLWAAFRSRRSRPLAPLTSEPASVHRRCERGVVTRAERNQNAETYAPLTQIALLLGMVKLAFLLCTLNLLDSPDRI